LFAGAGFGDLVRSRAEAERVTLVEAKDLF
jgi:hypothetical protein